MGDGTGCDNMTAVIVCFKPALNQCNTADSVSTKKRCASPVPVELGTELAHKRIKTDEENASPILAAATATDAVEEANVPPTAT